MESIIEKRKREDEKLAYSITRKEIFSMLFEISLDVLVDLTEYNNSSQKNEENKIFASEFSAFSKKTYKEIYELINTLEMETSTIITSFMILDKLLSKTKLLNILNFKL